MKRISILAIVLACASSAYAQESAADWAVKLGSRTYADRERAAAALEKLGKTALPALRAALLNADLETKRRAILIMERIEERVLADDTLTATPVRLQFKDMPLHETLMAIESHTGLSINKIKATTTTSVDTGELPFWQAWQRFCAAAKIQESEPTRAAAKLKRIDVETVEALTALLAQKEFEFRSMLTVPALKFATDPPFAGYAVDDRHSVRVRAKWHALDRSLDGKNLHAVFAFELRPEPRLEIVAHPRVEIVKFVDAGGMVHPVQTVKMFPDGYTGDVASFLATYVGESQHGGMLQLKAIPWQGNGQSLKELHGRVRLEVKARARMIEVPAILKAVGKQMRGPEGVNLKVLEAKRTEDSEIHVRLHLDDVDSLTPRTPDQQIIRVRPGVVAVRGAMDVALDRLELVDRVGRKCKLLKARYDDAENGKGYVADLYFAAPATKTDDATLVMAKAPRTVIVEMPFVVRDLAWQGK